jgi:hypothetical protein
MKRIRYDTPLDFQISSLTGLTRTHYEETIRVLLRGISQYVSPGYARFRLPEINNHPHSITDEVEGFARSFLMAAPWLKLSSKGNGLVDSEKTNIANIYRKGLLAGTSQDHPEYWGEIEDYSQIIVECSSIAWGLYLTKELIWDKYSFRQKEQIANYLLKCNQARSPFL